MLDLVTLALVGGQLFLVDGDHAFLLTSIISQFLKCGLQLCDLFVQYSQAIFQ